MEFCVQSQMEEFYRRKYLSPSYNRVTSYVDTLEKDKTVGELRKELQDCKEMQEKFDDLCLQIVKLERENKKIESEQSQVESEYMQKIKVNKAKITEYKQTILDYREDLESKIKKIEVLEGENDQLLSELQRIKKDAEENIYHKDTLYEKLESQEGLIAELKQKIEEGKAKAAETKKENQLKSEELEKNYQTYKKSQLKLKEEELENERVREELEGLVRTRQQWAKKTEIQRLKLETVKRELQAQEKEAARLDAKLKDAQTEKDKENQKNESIAKELKSKVAKSKENCLKVNSCQSNLLQTFKNLQKDQVYYQKMAVKEVQLKKGNERLAEILASMEETLIQEQESYSRIIGHMKVSIQQDQKAIESLSKQATLLEHMIS